MGEERDYEAKEGANFTSVVFLNSVYLCLCSHCCLLSLFPFLIESLTVCSYMCSGNKLH